MGTDHDNIRHPDLVADLAALRDLKDLLGDCVAVDFLVVGHRKALSDPLDLLVEHVIGVGVANLLQAQAAAVSSKEAGSVHPGKKPNPQNLQHYGAGGVSLP